MSSGQLSPASLLIGQTAISLGPSLLAVLARGHAALSVDRGPQIVFPRLRAGQYDKDAR